MQTKALAVLLSAASAMLVSQAQAETMRSGIQPRVVAKPVPNVFNGVRTLGCWPHRATNKMVILTNSTGALLKQGYVVIVHLKNVGKEWQTHVKLAQDLPHGSTVYATLYAPPPGKFTSCTATVNLAKPFGG